MVIFFFKQKTAYEMRISDWSSDVCSSDLDARGTLGNPVITGSLATGNAAINSPVTGMRLHGVRARGRFSGAQLVMTDFAATAQNGGSVTGTGSFTFMGVAGVEIGRASGGEGGGKSV